MLVTIVLSGALCSDAARGGVTASIEGNLSSQIDMPQHVQQQKSDPAAVTLFVPSVQVGDASLELNAHGWWQNGSPKVGAGVHAIVQADDVHRNTIYSAGGDGRATWADVLQVRAATPAAAVAKTAVLYAHVNGYLDAFAPDLDPQSPDFMYPDAYAHVNAMLTAANKSDQQDLVDDQGLFGAKLDHPVLRVPVPLGQPVPISLSIFVQAAVSSHHVLGGAVASFDHTAAIYGLELYDANNNLLRLPAGSVSISADSGQDYRIMSDEPGDLPGDANLDGAVGFGDLLTVAQNYAQPGEWITGDFTGDGTVGFPDLLVLAQHYGQNIDGTATASPVPEPSALAAASALVLLPRRRRVCRPRSHACRP